MNCLFVDLGKHYGGAEIYLTNLIGHMMKSGVHCSLLVKRERAFSETYARNADHCEILEADFSLKDLRKVRQYIEAEKIDVIHVNGIGSGVFRRLLFKQIPTVTTVHSNAVMDRTDRSKVIQKLFLLAENYCLRRSDRIIAVSQAMQDLLVQRNIQADKITVIENGISKIVYPPKEFSKGTLRICYVGRLEKVKGVQVLLEALANRVGENWRCDIYGDGTEKEGLVKQCQKAHLKNQVAFKGFCDNIRSILNEYDVLVQPSLYEAFPLTLVEAMNARTVVVCSDVGGMSKIIEDGITGYKFAVGNAGILSGILKNLIENREPLVQISDRAYSEFETNYVEDRMLQKTADVLEGTCTKQCVTYQSLFRSIMWKHTCRMRWKAWPNSCRSTQK